MFSKRLTFNFSCFAGLTVSLAFAVSVQADSFTPGDLVVYRVGSGGSTTLVNTGSAVFLDEYTPTGTLVQSIAMPTADATGGVHSLIASGTATSEGMLTLSPNGNFLTLTGYDAPMGTSGLASTPSTTVPRTVAIVNASGAVDTSTALTDFSTGNNPRTATTSDGTSIWVGGGGGGIRYTTIGSTTSTQLTTATNFRDVVIASGQLFASDSSGSAIRLSTIGTGLPTSGTQTATNLPGLPTNTGSPYQFAFADLSSAVAGMDTLYVADDTNNTTSILKYSLIGGTWTAEGSITAAGVRGLTLSVVGGNVDLYATSGGSGGPSGGGSLYSFVDTTGYGAAMSGSATSIASASTNEAFRGVAFAPVPEPSTALTLAGGIAVLQLLRRRRS